MIESRCIVCMASLLCNSLSSIDSVCGNRFSFCSLSRSFSCFRHFVVPLLLSCVVVFLYPASAAGALGWGGGGGGCEGNTSCRCKARALEIMCAQRVALCFRYVSSVPRSPISLPASHERRTNRSLRGPNHHQSQIDPNHHQSLLCTHTSMLYTNS